MIRYFLKDKLNICLYIIISIAVYILLTFVYKMYSVVTEVVQNSSYSEAYKTLAMGSIVLMALFIFLVLLSIVKRYALSRIMKCIRKDLFNKIKGMSVHSFNQNETSYYTSMLVNDTLILEESYYDKMFELFGDSMQLIIMFFAISLYGWKFTIVVALFSVFSVIQPFIMKKQLAEKGNAVTNQLEKYTACAKEYLGTWETIKGFQATNEIKLLFEKRVKELENENKKLWTMKMINSVLVFVAIYVLKVGAQLYFAYSAITGLITIATVTVLFGLANNVGNPIAAILSYFEPINSTKEIRKKISDFLEDKSCDEILGGQPINKSDFTIELKGLTYTYSDNKKVLNDLSVTFEKDKKYILVGESGCGKSTIMKLLMGYDKEYEGSIKIRNTELKEADIKELRDIISFVEQNPYIITGSIEENITLKNKIYSKKKIDQVIQMAQLKSFVNLLPNGLNESVSNNSSNLSGGEKQRISVARALIKEANIILMDEGTSALDNVTAIELEKELLQRENTTVISIVHRFSETIKDYDKIFYLENGKIVEQGNFEQLIKLNGKFCNMFNSQGGVEV